MSTVAAAIDDPHTQIRAKAAMVQSRCQSLLSTVSRELYVDK